MGLDNDLVIATRGIEPPRAGDLPPRPIPLRDLRSTNGCFVKTTRWSCGRFWNGSIGGFERIFAKNKFELEFSLELGFQSLFKMIIKLYGCLSSDDAVRPIYPGPRIALSCSSTLRYRL